MFSVSGTLPVPTRLCHEFTRLWVPFGEVKVVKDWLKITGEIHKPPVEHPKKPIWGFDCPRSEVSGQRFWGLFTKICKEPEAFFENCFVHNLCPLIFINHTGKSLTPPDLPAAERRMLLEICERAVCEVVQLLGIELVIGVGKFAQERARVALKAAGMEWIRVETIMHPSPANPLANKGWDAIAEKQLEEMGAMAIIKSAVRPTPPPPPVAENSSGDASNSSNNPQTPTSQGSVANTVGAGGGEHQVGGHNAIGNGAAHINANSANNTTSHVTHNNTSTTAPHLVASQDPQPATNACNEK
ncbi:hypothetical protein LSH36_640g01056 [Paralvinella palmiformis]|uniref:Single-strand selective monofunctional uracil DNA glycosylase n=1 Tax=Paralvinella palmiformis TaxID=53620 RepID=A0AAD9J5G7_9ANNE|nr:hypothetical protein LSH36_640g01056 [Paralvinella palmiformis]